MNGEGNFGINNNYINDNNMNSEPATYDSYYNHKPRKKPWWLFLLLIVLALIVLGWLYFSGFFTPMDRQAEYNKMYTRVCNAAVKYAKKNKEDVTDIVGKIVYITTGDLTNANMIEASLINHLTNQSIPASTRIRLEVLPNKNFQCHDFLWPGDDKVKPVITLKGEATITLNVGQKATDPGATALDDQDGDISERIKRSGDVDTDVLGTYYVYYSVSDISGNLSDIIIRTYIVQ